MHGLLKSSPHTVTRSVRFGHNGKYDDIIDRDAVYQTYKCLPMCTRGSVNIVV